ncbi:class I SAM-dependent methyltransferase [Nocardiopsis gilva]
MNGGPMKRIDLDLLGELYRKYTEPLAKVRDQQRAFCRDMRGKMTPQLDDLEAEITYLLLREHRPAIVMELGTFHGWSTSWILSALRDNGTGHLHSFDIVDNVVSNVPAELSADRWTFHKGDVRENVDAIPGGIEYLFVDAAHNGRFARWYIDHLFPRVAAGTPVSVHDVFHQSFALPFTEGRAVLKWLAEKETPYFTPSKAKAPDTYRAIHAIKRDLGLDEPVRTGKDNPMIYFHLPA